MWKTLYQSVQGTSHERLEVPCQDSSRARLLALGDENVLVLACSDGAGSAMLSDVGSRVACQTLVDRVADDLQTAGRLDRIEPDGALAWLRHVHQTLAAAAAALDVEARQLACTLLFAVLGDRGAAFGQIGDGVIVARQDDRYEHVFWPQSGEYANTTNFITDPRFESLAESTWYDCRLDEAALMTDGLQMLALDFGERRVHVPFFAPLFAALRQQADADALEEPMRTFLQSPQVAERTDDDKTLILATRLTP